MTIAFGVWSIVLTAAVVLFLLCASVLLVRIRARGYAIDALVGASLITFLAVLFAGTLETTPAAAAIDPASSQEAAVISSHSSGTCASLQQGGESSRAKALLGPPDLVEPASHLRGPGAEIWRYEASRCAVHIFEGKIEFIE
jgi:hypothetical protein